MKKVLLEKSILEKCMRLVWKASPLGRLVGLLLILGTATLSQVTAQTRLYVKATGGSNANDGKTWLNAVQSLDTALNRAQANDTILVAAGTYKGGFFMKEGVTVLGGFPANATNATTLKDRKLPGTGENLTVLDGENNKRPLTQLKPFSTPTVWEGFVLQNGASTVENINIGSIIYGNDNQPAGVLYQYNTTTKSGYMVSLQEVEKQWGGYGTNISGLPNITSSAIAQADSAGASNTALIVKQLGVGDYAAYWADMLTAGGFTQWYLPAAGELYTLYQQKANINKSLKSLQNDTLRNAWYWASFEYNANYAWYVNFGDGNVSIGFKPNNYAARAVRVFNSFSHLTNLAFCGGGALLQNKGVLRLCVVENCTASAMGGGVYANTGASVEGCLVQNNTAPNGSGVYNGSGSLVNSTVVNNTSLLPPKYKVGDLYTFPNSQQGIVFYIDATGEHGWAVALQDANTGNECQWLPVGSHTIPGITITTEPSAAIADTAGYKNTQALRNYIDTCSSTINRKESYAAYKTDFANGWYLPAAGQLDKLYAVLPEVNAALTAYGGTQLKTSESPYYWSSTQYHTSSAWYVSFVSGYVFNYSVNGGSRVRSVRAFQLFNPLALSEPAGLVTGTGSQTANTIVYGNTEEVSHTAANLYNNRGTITYTAAEGTVPVGTGNKTVSASDFINAANKDFNLKETSALRNAGNVANVPAGLTQDLAGANRIIENKTDIGAFQTKATPVITWNNPSDITYGTPLSETQLNATANTNGTFVYTPAVGKMLNAGNNQTLKVTFTPTNAGSYNTLAAQTVTINVTKATQSINLDCAQLNNAKVGDTLTLTATSGLAVSVNSSNPLVVKVEDSKLIFLSVGSTTITATQAGDNNYLVAEEKTCPIEIKSTTRYVASTGSATAAQAVGSFANACNNLQAVINIARNGDTILVAAGTYTGSFIMKEGITVLGGFPQNADATTTLQDRKLPGTGENLTILDGENTQRPLTQLKPFSTPTVWEGFVLQNGSAPTGGGAYLQQNSILRNTIVQNNTVKTPIPGQYIPEQGGVVYRVQGATAYVMAMEDCKGGFNDKFATQTATPYINNCTDANTDFNGKAATDSLLAKGSGAAIAASNYRDAAGHTDWYLPAVGDWKLFVSGCQAGGNKTAIFDTVQNALTRNGGKGIETSNTPYYWSSTTYNASSAWSVSFNYGNVYGYDIYFGNRVRSVRAFQLFNYLGGGIYMGAGASVEGCLVQNNTAPNGSGVYNGSGSLLNSTVVNNIADTSLLAPKPKYKVGDLYTFPNSQQGIVFYVDATGEHGWAVALQDSSATCQWLPSGSHIIPGITVTTDQVTALTDTAGYKNTQALRNYIDICSSTINSKESNAAYKTDFANGWYLPAAGQLDKLYAVLPEVNEALTAYGGTRLETSNSSYYWSSTQYNASFAWLVYCYNGLVSNGSMSDGGRVRSVRAFQLFDNLALSNPSGLLATTGSQTANTIVYGNTEGVSHTTANLYTMGGTVTYTAVEGTVPMGEGNKTVSENDFIDADNRDFRLTETSALRAAGHTASVPAGLRQDLAGKNRIIDNKVDIGVFQTKVTPVITWNNPSDITYGTPLSETQLNATANTNGTFVYTPAVGKILDAGNNQTLSVNFTPTDGINYTTATKEVKINVSKATQTLTFDCNQLSSAKIGDEITLSATATSNLEVSFESSNPPVAKIEGTNKLVILSAGSVTITAIQTGNNNYEAAEEQSCTLTIKNNDATLKSLTVSHGVLEPAFNPAVTNYTVNVANSVDKITLTAEANHALAIIRGHTGEQNLQVGKNVFTITVTAQDGATKKTYTVEVIRQSLNPSNDATLKSLTVSHGVLEPAFIPAVTNYTLNVVDTLTNHTITAEANHELASVDGHGVHTLQLGENKVEITVTAEDGTTKVYTVNVIRERTSGIKGLGQQALSVTIYPNPVKEILHIKTDERIENAAIYTIGGQECMHLNQLNGNTINVSNLPAGMYILKLKTSKGEIINRFVKQ